MWIEDDDPDPNSGFAPLIEELERYGGVLAVVDDPSATSSSEVLHLHLPDDEYRAQKCREVLKQWHNTQD